MRKLLAACLVAMLAVLAPVSAMATFTLTGQYASPTLSGNCATNGFLTGQYPNFTITGSDVAGVGWDCTTAYTDTFASSGTITFDWSYVSYDQYGGAYWDPAGYVINGGLHALATCGSHYCSPNSSIQSGSAVISIQAGDVFGWYVESLDDYGGPAALTVFNVQFVPEPALLPLVALGLAGLAFTRRRHQ